MKNMFTPVEISLQLLRQCTSTTQLGLDGQVTTSLVLLFKKFKRNSSVKCIKSSEVMPEAFLQ